MINTNIRNNKKLFVSPKKLKKLLLSKKKTIVIYDTREKLFFDEQHIKQSIRIDKLLLRSRIMEHDKKDWIVLVGNEAKSNLIDLLWAKNNKYKHIYHLNIGVRKWPY